MTNRISVLLLPWLMCAACLPQDEPQNDLSVEESSSIVTTVCSVDTTLTEARGQVDLAAFIQNVPYGERRLVRATLTGTASSSSESPDPMEGVYVTCTGPKNKFIETTQNALRGGGALTIHANLVIGPGQYQCVMSASTAHPGARIDLDGSRSCIVSEPSQAQDWPSWRDDDTVVGPGRRIYLHFPQYVLAHNFTFPASTNTFAVRGNIHLTDIFSSASGTTTIPECNSAPYDSNASAFPVLHLEARQLSTTGYCGQPVIGPDMAVEITPMTHHRKVYPVLDNVPVSHAPGCLPTFETKVYIATRGGGNDVCFHAAHYSNVYVFPQS